MAIGTVRAAKAYEEKALYNDNLMPTASTFEDSITWNDTQTGGAGSIVVSHDSNNFYKKDKSLKLVISNWTGTIDTGDTSLQFTVGKTGTYIISGRLRSETSFSAQNALFSFNVYVNGILTEPHRFWVNIDDAYDFVFGKWNTYFQNIALTSGDVVDIQFGVEYTGASLELNLDGLKFELQDRDNYLPTLYSYPKEQYHGWQSRVDTVNTQVIPPTTSTIVPVSIGLEENGGLTLMDVNSKITPISLGDYVICDFAFTAVTPAGSDHFCIVEFVVNGVVYRSMTIKYMKGTGLDDNIAVSYGLPVSSDFLTYGGTFNVYSDVAVTIKNRYIAVSRTHKGV